MCSVVALAAAAAATDAATAQPFDLVPHDIRTGVYQGEVVTYEVFDGPADRDDDIILGALDELSPDGGPILAGERDIQTKISAVSDKQELWPRGVIYYTIDPELTNPHVPEAIRHWEEHTPIRFIERTHQARWLRFRPSGGICAAVLVTYSNGRRDSYILLGDRCGLGATIHEIGHVAGLWHEQERNDRGEHIWVAPGSDPRSGSRGLDSGPYDYGSVMHYPCIETMVTIPPGIPCGSGALSAGDIDGVSRLYGKTPTETTITTIPAGLLIEVDGETYTAPHRFDWKPGSKHIVGVPAPQQFVGDRYYAGDKFRFIFAKWSDGGAQTHSVTASPETTVFIANFIWQNKTEYEYSTVPPQGGTIRVEPPSSDGFYTRFASIKLFAEPAEGFSFKSWRSWDAGNGPASNPKATTGGISHQQAIFTREPLTTIDTNVPGSDIAVDGVREIIAPKFRLGSRKHAYAGAAGSRGNRTRRSDSAFFWQNGRAAGIRWMERRGR
ncbi:MAG: M12 family metallopeptidase [Bryobacterales bacterium]|nr:M12 family metallopeptidase [Bryobacterales bacterium]